MALFTFRGVYVSLQPAGHGHYKATAYYTDNSTVSVIFRNMEWVDRLNFPDNYTKKEVQEAKSAIYSYILEKKNNR